MEAPLLVPRLLLLFLLASSSVGSGSPGHKPVLSPQAGNLPSAPSILSTRDGLGSIQPTCQNSGYSECGGSLPLDFCCPASDVCLSLAANTTGLCCPQGSSCALIRPIVCDIRAQNVTAAPHSSVHTVALDQPLPRCGKSSDGASTCCPFGYICANTTCIINSSQGVDVYGYLVPRQRAAANTSGPVLPAGTSVMTPADATGDLQSSVSGGGGINKIAVAVASAATGSFLLTGIAICFWMRRARPGPFKTMSPAAIQRKSTPQKAFPRLSRKSSPAPSPPSCNDPVPAKQFMVPLYTIQQQSVCIKSPSPVELPASPLSYDVWTSRQSFSLARPETAKPAYPPFRALRRSYEEKQARPFIN